MLKLFRLPRSFWPAPLRLRCPSYSVVGTYKAADGGWDILSVDPVAHRLYVGRGFGDRR